MDTINLTLKLSIFIIVGFMAVRLKVVGKDFHKPLASLMMNFAIPALIVRSFYNTELTQDTLASVGSIIEIAAVSFALLFVLGIIAQKLMKVPHQKKVAIYALLTSNFTFFGMPFVESVFGSEGLFYYTIFTVFARIIYYGCPAYLLGDGEKGSIKDFLSHMASPSIMSVFVGFGLYLVQCHPPVFLDTALEGLANVCTPLGMMLCGMTLAGAPLKESFSKPSLIYMSIARLLISPAVIMVVCYLIGFRSLFIELAVVYCAMPYGALLPTFSTRYCSDSRSSIYGSALVSVSTLLCVVTIPFWLFIFNHVF